MILNGFCLSCAASSRTTIGGLMTMTSALAGATNFGCGAGAGALRSSFCGVGAGGLPPGLAGAADRVGNLAGPAFSLVLGDGLCGNWMNPTLSPILGPAGLGGGGGGLGASTTGGGSGLISGSRVRAAVR